MAGTDRFFRRGVASPSSCTPVLRGGVSCAGANEVPALRTMMAGKIHRATVTEANLDYVGSITLDPVLMDAAGILPYEQVHVLDVTNGSRLETYTITGRRGSGEVCINGAAAHLVHEGDLVIIVAYQQLPDDEARSFVPRQVHVDARNRVLSSEFSVPRDVAALAT